MFPYYSSMISNVYASQSNLSPTLCVLHQRIASFVSLTLFTHANTYWPTLPTKYTFDSFFALFVNFTFFILMSSDFLFVVINFVCTIHKFGLAIGIKFRIPPQNVHSIVKHVFDILFIDVCA